MELKNVAMSTLRPVETINLADQLVAQTLAPWDGILSKRIERVQQFSSLLADTIHGKRKSDFTELLAMQDDARDDGYKSFFFGVMSAVHSNEPAIKAAGEKLLEIIERHETAFSTLGYDSKTVELKSLYIETVSLTADISAAETQRQYNQMVTAITDWNALVKEKKDKESTLSKGNVTDVSRALADVLELLLQQVRILIDDEEDGIDALVVRYNEVIEQIMSKVRARKTRSLNSANDQQSGDTDDSHSDAPSGPPLIFTEDVSGS